MLDFIKTRSFHHAEAKNAWTDKIFIPHMPSWRAQGRFFTTIFARINVINSHSLKITLVRKPKHVAVTMF
jgi:hypothetical protein